MRSRFLALAGLLAAAPLVAADDPSDGVSEARLKADVERLVAFGTRHTLSEQDNPTRGIGAAVDWGAATFRAISADCGNCLEVVLPERMIEGNRIPAPVRLRNAVAIQRGTERPNEVVIVQGHIDSRVSDVMDATSDAPGANDWLALSAGLAFSLNNLATRAADRVPLASKALVSFIGSALLGGLFCLLFRQSIPPLDLTLTWQISLLALGWLVSQRGLRRGDVRFHPARAEQGERVRVAVPVVFNPVPARHDLLDRHFLFHQAFQDIVERRIGRQTILIGLIGAQFCRWGFGDDVFRYHLAIPIDVAGQFVSLGFVHIADNG